MYLSKGSYITPHIERKSTITHRKVHKITPSIEKNSFAYPSINV